MKDLSGKLGTAAKGDEVGFLMWEARRFLNKEGQPIAIPVLDKFQAALADVYLFIEQEDTGQTVGMSKAEQRIREAYFKSILEALDKAFENVRQAFGAAEISEAVFQVCEEEVASICIILGIPGQENEAPHAEFALQEMK